MFKIIKKFFKKKEMPRMTTELFDTYQQLTEVLAGMPANVGRGTTQWTPHWVRLPIQK